MRTSRESGSSFRPAKGKERLVTSGAHAAQAGAAYSPARDRCVICQLLT